MVGTNYQLRLDSDDSNVGAPVAGTGGSIIFTVSPAATTVYNVLARIVATGCQAEVTDKSTVTVNPAAPGAAGPIAGSTNVCYGESGIVYSITAVPNAANYVWTVPAGLTIASGQGTISITVDFAPGAASPRTIQVYPENGCGPGGISSVSVSIYPDLTIGTISGSTSPICYNTDEGTLTANPSGGNGTYAYEWFKNGVTTGITTQTYAAGNLTANTNYYYKVTSCGQTKQSPTVNITVTPDLVIGTITGATTPICYNTNEGTLTANPSGGNGTYAYEWFKDGITTGITTQTYAAGNLTANTNYYYKVTSCGQTKQSPTVNITVNPDLVIGTITGSTSPICYGANAGTYTANPSGGNGTYAYEWFKDGITTGITTQTYAAGVLTANASYYYKVTSCGQTKQSPTVNITVTPDLVIGTITGAITPICYNMDEGTLTANPSGGNGTYSYEWFKNGATTGITTQTYAAGNLIANTNYYYKVTSCGQTKQSPTVNITVTPDLVIGTITGATSPICYDTDEGTLTANPSGGDGTYAYEWFKNGATTGITTQTYAAGNLTANTNYYYKVISCGQTKQSPTVNITVNPDLVIGTITGSTSPICYGANAGTYTANPSGGNGTYTYEWFKDGITTGITTQTYAAGVLTANASYYYKVTSCGQTKQSPTVNITVTPDLVIGTITGAITPICYNMDEGTLTANPSGGNGTYSYEWFKNGATTGITTQTYAAGNLTANTNYYYKVTSCGQTKQSPTVNITVTPDLVTGTITGATTPICSGTDEGTLTANPSGGDGTYAYEWFKDGVTTGITTQTFVAGNLTANATYYYKVTSCNQTKQSIPLVVTVNPVPLTTDISGDPLICQDASNVVYEVADHAGSNYTWTVPGVVTKTFDGNLYFIMVDGNAPGSGDIEVFETITATGCIGPVKTFNVTVSPIIPGNPVTGPANVCKDAIGHYVVLPDNPGSTYSWSLPPGAFISSADPGAHEVDVTFPLAVNGTVSVFETNGACSSFHPGAPVTVHPLPVPAIAGSASACVNSTGNIYFTEAGMSAYVWTISAGGTITAGAGTSSITVDWNTAGAQTITVNYTDANSCTASAPTMKGVSVYPLPVPTISGNNSACLNSSGNALYHGIGYERIHLDSHRWYNNLRRRHQGNNNNLERNRCSDYISCYIPT